MSFACPAGLAAGQEGREDGDSAALRWANSPAAVTGGTGRSLPAQSRAQTLSAPDGSSTRGVSSPGTLRQPRLVEDLNSTGKSRGDDSVTEEVLRGAKTQLRDGAGGIFHRGTHRNVGCSTLFAWAQRRRPAVGLSGWGSLQLPGAVPPRSTPSSLPLVSEAPGLF